MQQLDLSLAILADVLDEKTPFAEALRKTFQSNVAIRDMRGDVAGLVGCELRHHLLFSYLLKNVLPDENERRAASLLLSNVYFFHRFDEKLNDAVKEMLGEEKYALLGDLLAKKDEPNSLIPESVGRSSNLYLSLRYNTPEWVLKILEHFGFGNTYKTLRKLGRPNPSTLRVCESLVSMDEVLSDPSFVATDIPGLVRYLGKTSLRKNALYKAGKIFDEKSFARNLILHNRIGAPKQILVYEGTPSSQFALDVIETYGDSIGINIAVDDTDSKVQIARLIRDKGLHNVNYFSAPQASTLTSAVSCKQDLIIVAPESTSFDDIPSAPDFLLRFNKEGMDTIISNEAKALANASEFLEDGGKLLYVIFTISKKEGHLTVTSFLRDHPEFTLTSERQYFPFEAEGVSAYVAEITKGRLEDTLAEAIQGLRDLAAEQAK